MSFEIKSEEQEGFFLVHLIGKLDSSTSNYCKDKFELIEEKLKFRTIIFDLKDLEFISSVGWGIFMNFSEEVKKSECELILTNMNSNLSRLYVLMGIRNVIRSFRNIDEAMKNCV